MKTEDLKLRTTCYAYPEQYDVIYIPKDSFLRRFLRLPVRPISVAYIRYRNNFLECYPIREDFILFGICLYSEKVPEKYGNAKLPEELRDRIFAKCFKAIRKWYRLRKIIYRNNLEF